jgi:hypothetical protein
MNREEAQRILNALSRFEGRSDLSEAEASAVARLTPLRAEAEKAVAGYGAAYRGMAHDALLGQRDTLGGVASALTGGSYEEGRDAVRDKDRAAYTANPQAFESGQLAGGMATMGATAALGAPLLQGANWLTRALAGAGVGGGFMANQIAQDDQVKNDPPMGAGRAILANPAPFAAGALVGGMAEPLALAAGATSRGLRNLLEPGVAGMSAKASRPLVNAAGRAARTGGDPARDIAEFTPEAMLADLPEFRPLAQGLAAQGGDGGMVVGRSLRDRAQTNGDRIRRDVTEYLGEPNAAFEAKRANAEARSGQWGPEYGAAIAMQEPVDVRGLISDLTGSVMRYGPTTAPAMRRFLTDLQEKAPEGFITADQLHWIRSDLSDELNNTFGPTKGNATLKSMLDSIDAVLDTQVDGYQAARAGYANTKAMDRAVDEGTSMLRGGRVSALTPDQVRAQFEAMSPAEQDAYRAGVRSDIEALMGTARNDAAAAWGEFNKEWNAEKLRIVLGQDAEPIIRRLRSEQRFSETQGAVLSGSQTAQRQEASAALGPLRDPESGRTVAPESRIKEAIWNRPANALMDSVVYGPRASRANEELGRALAAQGSDRDALIQELARRLMERQNRPNVSPAIENMVRMLSLGSVPVAGQAVSN